MRGARVAGGTRRWGVGGVRGELRNSLRRSKLELHGPRNGLSPLRHAFAQMPTLLTKWASGRAGASR
eukprot:15462541-Alexandrium_andersonii.AAC.1